MEDSVVHLRKVADRLMKQSETLRKESDDLIREAKRLKELANVIMNGQSENDA